MDLDADVAGRRVHVESADSGLVEAVGRVLGLRPPDAAPRGGRPLDCLLRLSRGASPHPRPDGAAFDFGQGEGIEAGDVLHLAIGRSVVRGCGGPLVEAWVDVDGLAGENVVVAHALRAGLRRCGVFDLHAAALVPGPGPEGVLLVGPKGSGKTTLTIEWAAAGGQFLSDDLLALVQGTSGGVEAMTLRRRFCVVLASLDRHRCAEELRDALGAPMGADRRKRWLEPRLAFPGAFRERCRPAAIVFLSRGPGPPRLRPLGAADVFGRLLAVSPWAAYDRFTARAHVAVLAGLARACRGHLLEGEPALAGEAGGRSPVHDILGGVC